MSYSHIDDTIYPARDLLPLGIEEFTESFLRHLQGKINNDIIELLGAQKYSQAFDSIEKLGLSNQFEYEYLQWYKNNEDEIAITLFDNDDFYLKDYKY